MRLGARSVCLVAFLWVCGPVLTAQASEGEHALSLRPNHVWMIHGETTAHQLGASVDYAYSLTDSLGLVGELGWLHTVGSGNTSDVTMGLGLEAKLDALVWIPSARVMAIVREPTENLSFGGELSLGLEYRAWRQWGMGAQLAVNLLSDESGGVRTAIRTGLFVSFYWSL